MLIATPPVSAPLFLVLSHPLSPVSTVLLSLSFLTCLPPKPLTVRHYRPLPAINPLLSPSSLPLIALWFYSWYQCKRGHHLQHSTQPTQSLTAYSVSLFIPQQSLSHSTCLQTQTQRFLPHAAFSQHSPARLHV